MVPAFSYWTRYVDLVCACVGVPEIIPVELSKYKEVGKSGAIVKAPSVGVIFLISGV